MKQNEITLLLLRLQKACPSAVDYDALMVRLIKARNALYPGPGPTDYVAFSDPPDYGDRMSIREFVYQVLDGGLIDYDGSGALGTLEKMSSVRVTPSMFTAHGYAAPEWATHIYWFNK